MRIAIDARHIQPRLQGVGRHVLNLLLGLSFSDSDLEFLVLYQSPFARHLVERSGGPLRGRFQWIRARSEPGSLLERMELPWLLKMHKADLFHDAGPCGLWSLPVPTVVIVHELANIKLKADALRRSFRKAQLIVCVTDSLAQEVENKFNLSRPKIRVVSNAIDPWYNETVSAKEVAAMRDRFRLHGKYYLCVTADKPSKNFDFTRGCAWEWKGEEEWVFTVEGHDRGPARFLGVVEDVWLRPLYAACSALVAPSLYEGFSLPPIEALSCGTLPVVSDIAAHRETLNDILMPELFFDPRSKESLQKALSAVENGGEPLKAAVLEKFRAVRDRYSFKERAEQVQGVYREALRG